MLTLQFLASLRGPSRIKVFAVAVLRGPPLPSVDKGVEVAVLRGPSWSFVAKGVEVAVLRGPLWPSVDKGVEVAVLRGPLWPSVDKGFEVAAIRAALRGQRRRSCSSPRPSEAVLDAPKKTASVNEHRAQTAALRSLAYVDESDETRGMTPEDCDPETAKLIAEAFGEGAYVSSHCKP